MFENWRRLTPSRRNVCDLLHFARKVPSHLIERQIDLLSLSQLRKRSVPRIGWATLFFKAMGLVSEKMPEARRLFMKYPWDHFYEHQYSIGRITVSRQYRAEDCVFMLKIFHPENLSLPDIQQQIDDARYKPIEEIPRFRLLLRIANLPKPLRRLLWWTTLNLSGKLRSLVFGTFGISTVSSQGATIVYPPTLGSCVFTYGPISLKGKVRIAIVYDHRVVDGGFIAKMMQNLEESLQNEIYQELLDLIEDSLSDDISDERAA